MSTPEPTNESTRPTMIIIVLRPTETTQTKRKATPAPEPKVAQNPLPHRGGFVRPQPIVGSMHPLISSQSGTRAMHVFSRLGSRPMYISQAYFDSMETKTA